MPALNPPSLPQTTLLWILGALTFFMSAILDNLTSTIVMVSLIRKLVKASIAGED